MILRTLTWERGQLPMNATKSLTPPGADQREHAKRHAQTHFDRWAGSYDRSWLNELVFFPSLRACREEIIRWQQQRGERPYRLLDVGCGTGNLLLTIAEDEQAEEIVGLDYSPEMVRRAETKITHSPHAKRLRVMHGDAENLPREDSSLDVATCCNSFHHYPHQAAVIREFHRVLRPGGLLILIDGFRDNVIGWIIFDVAVALVEGHVHHTAWSETRRMVADAGFQGLRQRKLNVLAPLLVTVAHR